MMTSKLIARFLTLCGVSLTCTACYAMPPTDYMANIEGMVTDGETGAPIEGIVIRSSYTEYDGEQRERNMDRSDELGKFGFRHHALPPDTITFTAEDVDGPENGEYATKSAEILFSGTGSTVKIDFALTPKTTGR